MCWKMPNFSDLNLAHIQVVGAAEETKTYGGRNIVSPFMFSSKAKVGSPTRGCALGNRRDEEIWLALDTGTFAAAIEFDVLVQALVGDRLVGAALNSKRGRLMYIQRRHWLEYDPVALAVLVIGIGIIELLALII